MSIQNLFYISYVPHKVILVSASKFRLVRTGNGCGMWLIVTVTITILLVYTLFVTLFLHLQCKENSTFYIIAREPVSKSKMAEESDEE